MYICLCRAVSDATVEEALEEGAHTVDEIAERCGAGVDCGGCRETLASMLEARGPCGAACADCPRRRGGLYSPSPALGEAA